jgi:hypothetical protein
METQENWLHGRNFSALAYVPALIVGSFAGVFGFVFALFLSEENILSAEILTVPLMAGGIYLKLLDYFFLTLSLSSIIMAPVTFVLLHLSRNWRLKNTWKYALLGMPVAALFALGQITVWRAETGDTLVDFPAGTVGAIVVGGAVGGLVYLGVAAMHDLSHRHEGTPT